jgi:hypothetical protein
MHKFLVTAVATFALVIGSAGAASAQGRLTRTHGMHVQLHHPAPTCFLMARTAPTRWVPASRSCPVVLTGVSAGQKAWDGSSQAADRSPSAARSHYRLLQCARW